MSTNTQLKLSREIKADPTSTALLLAGPTALDLWPGLRRTGNVDGLVSVEAKVARETATAVVRAEPPRRLPTSFVTAFRVTITESKLPDADGLLTLQYSERDGEVTTTAVLELTSEDSLAALKVGAQGFLKNLGEAAEKRARAA